MLRTSSAARLRKLLALWASCNRFRLSLLTSFSRPSPKVDLFSLRLRVTVHTKLQVLEKGKLTSAATPRTELVDRHMVGSPGSVKSARQVW